MKIVLAALAASTILAAPAFANELDPVAEADVYRYFVAVKGGYGPSFIDNDFEGAESKGEFDDDLIFGGSIELGAFVTERIKLSVEVNYGRIEHENQVINGTTFQLDGGTNLTQVFAKAAYEVELADLGFSAPIFERTSVIGLGGIGFTHINSGGTLRGFDAGAFNPAAAGVLLEGRQEEEDTVFSAKVGLGTVYRLTDRIDLVSETSFIFGTDAELSSAFALPAALGGGEVKSISDVETNAIVSQLGLRFKF